jgi:hypothetical protein
MKNRTKTYEKRVAHDFHFFAFKRLIFVLAYIRISRCGLRCWSASEKSLIMEGTLPVGAGRSPLKRTVSWS